MSHQPQTTQPLHVPEALQPLLTFALPTVPVNPYEVEVFTDSPLAWWRGRNATATTWPDAGFFADGSFDATPHGALSLRRGRVVPSGDGSALYCNGVDAWASVPDGGTSIDIGLLDVSFEFWFRADLTTSQVCLFSKGDGFSIGGWGIYLEADGTLSALINGVTQAYTVGSLLDGRHHHVVLTVDRTQDLCTFTVDGVRHADYDATALIGQYIQSAYDVGIGCENFTNAPAKFYHGLIDEVAIYRAALTPARIQQHYLAGQARATGIVGVGGATYAGKPMRYTTSASNAPTARVGTPGFTIAATVVISTDPIVSNNVAVTSAHVLSTIKTGDTGGCALTVQSGRVAYWQCTDSGAYTSLVVSYGTTAGTILRTVITQAPSLVTLWIGGTAVGTTAPASWSVQTSLTLGAKYNQSAAWSYGLYRDVYCFARPLASGEVRRLLDVTP